MPRTLTIAALLPALGVATAVWAPPAQAGGYQAAPARQLTWPGRPPATRPAQMAAQREAQPSVQPTAYAADDAPAYDVPAYDASPYAPEAAAPASRPPVIPHGGYPWRAAPPGFSRQLTPAQAWGAPSPIPAPPLSANALTPAPDFRQTTSHPDATWRPYVEPPTTQPPPAYVEAQPTPYAAPPPAPWTRAPLTRAPAYAATPDRGPPPVLAAEPPRVEPRPAMEAPPQPALPPMVAPQPDAPAPTLAPVAADPAPADPAADPMAPRRDALIFQLQRNAPQPLPPTPAASPAPAPTMAPTTAAAPADPAAPVARDGGGARYYSVHRQAGRQPDATPLPAPVYLDALPVQLDQPPASTDLAEPPAAPTVIRDANGRLRAASPIDDPL